MGGRSPTLPHSPPISGATDGQQTQAGCPVQRITAEQYGVAMGRPRPGRQGPNARLWGAIDSGMM
jgi:hypothetical protein